MATEEINTALEALSKIDASIAGMQESVKKGEAAQADVQKKIDELGEKQVLFSRQLLDIQQKAQKAEGAADLVDKSIGAQFVNSDSYKRFKGTSGARSASAEVSNKSAENPVTSAQAKLVPYRVPGIVPLDTRELTIEGLFPRIPTAAQTIEYMREKTFTNGAATVAEAAMKPSSSFEFELKQTPVQVIAHWTKITRQLADDAPALQAFINARMIYGVNLAAEDQLLTGDGTSPNLSGIMAAGNYTAQSFKLADIGGAGSTMLDLLRVSFATINAAGFRTSAVVLNPVDWAVLQGLKATDGVYLLGSPANSFASSSIWGVRVVESAAMAKGKFLAGDFARAATVYDRMSTVVDIAAQNEDDFIKNLYTIRAERRLALAVEHSTAVIGGALAVPSA